LGDEVGWEIMKETGFLAEAQEVDEGERKGMDCGWRGSDPEGAGKNLCKKVEQGVTDVRRRF